MKKETFQLNNVIYSKALSENLLTLRHFAEAGWAILLDKKTIRVFDPKTKKILVTGIYESPYWFIEFEIHKRDKETSYLYETEFQSDLTKDETEMNDLTFITKQNDEIKEKEKHENEGLIQNESQIIEFKSDQNIRNDVIQKHNPIKTNVINDVVINTTEDNLYSNFDWTGFWKKDN